MNADDGALFPAYGPGPGPVRLAMDENIGQWHAAGRALSPALVAALRAQADAVDTASRSGRASQVSGANDVLTKMLQTFGLLGDVPGKGGDKFDQLVAQLTAMDDG